MGKYNVHEATRNALLKNLLRTDTTRLQALSAKALEVTARDNTAQDIADRLYHKLIARPDEAADECEELFRGFPNTARIETQESVRVALEELKNNEMLSGRPLLETLLLIGWGWYCTRRSQSITQSRRESVGCCASSRTRFIYCSCALPSCGCR